MSDTSLETGKPEIVQYGKIQADIEVMKAKNTSLVFDYHDPAGNKAARSQVFRLRQTKADVERVRKVAKAEALEYGRKVDSVAKELTAEVEAMIDVHQQPLDEIEQREAAKKRAEQEAAETAARAEAERIEAERQAELAKERAEAERLRAELAAREQRERDERLVREATERARAEAEAKAKAEQEATRRREHEAVERERQALVAAREAEEHARQAEAKARENEARRQREAKAEAQREAAERAKNQHIRDAVIREVFESLLNVLPDLTAPQAHTLATAMLDGKIARVSVNTENGAVKKDEDALDKY